jgi:hypothetical protein
MVIEESVAYEPRIKRMKSGFYPRHPRQHFVMETKMSVQIPVERFKKALLGCLATESLPCVSHHQLF